MARYQVKIFKLLVLGAGCWMLVFSGCTTAVKPAAKTVATPASAAAEKPVAEGPVVLATTNPVLAEAYGQINLADGVDEEEAETIADAYFKVFISGCGMASGVTDATDTWEVATFLDYAMKPYKPILVDKKNGRMSCEGYPTVVSHQ